METAVFQEQRLDLHGGDPVLRRQLGRRLLVAAAEHHRRSGSGPTTGPNQVGGLTSCERSDSGDSRPRSRRTYQRQAGQAAGGGQAKVLGDPVADLALPQAERHNLQLLLGREPAL